MAKTKNNTNIYIEGKKLNHAWAAAALARLYSAKEKHKKQEPLRN